MKNEYKINIIQTFTAEFIVKFGSEDVYYQWIYNFTHGELGK